MKPNYDPTSGWALDAATPLGGVRGKRIDQAIADITAVNPAIAAVLPVFVVGTVWKGPDQFFQFSDYDPDRYALPPVSYPLNEDQVNQVIWNEQHYNAFLTGAWMWANNRETFLADLYHGEPGRAGFPKYAPDTNGGSFLPGTSISPLSPQEAAIRSANSGAFPHPMPFSLVPGHGGHMTPQPMVHQIAADHFLATVWFDLTTDINVARYYRNWARSFGVDIAAEPTE